MGGLIQEQHSPLGLQILSGTTTFLRPTLGHPGMPRQEDKAESMREVEVPAASEDRGSGGWGCHRSSGQEQLRGAGAHEPFALAAYLPLQTSVSTSVKWVDNACTGRLLSGLIWAPRGLAPSPAARCCLPKQEESRTQYIVGALRPRSLLDIWRKRMNFFETNLHLESKCFLST